MFRFAYLCLASFAIACLVVDHFPSLDSHAFFLSKFNVTWFAVCSVGLLVVGHRVTGGKH